MASDADWPQALRELTGRAFGQCTDANRGAVSAELKRLIFQAVQDGSLHTRDWTRVRLASLGETRKRSAPDVTAKARRFREDPSRREMRQRRFDEEQAAYEREQQADRDSAVAQTSLAARFGQAPIAAGPDPNVIDWDAYTVVGTSTKLEKPYLRLTSAPDPKTVRPLATLRRTLEWLMQKWAAERNYAYMCDQLKSMRQDLTVQRIKNEFTVQVYELHARLALDVGDLGEYNQCQSQLRALYAYGLNGSRLEFLAYRILYLLHTRQQRDVNTLMAELSDEAQADAAVRHALDVRAAMRCGNYHRFFDLYAHAPNRNACLMHHFVDRERVQALSIVARAFRPSCTLAFLTSELGWSSEDEARAFLAKHGAACYLGAAWDTKSAQAPLGQALASYRHVDLQGQWSSSS